jgi:hypothetical protein
MLSRYGLLVILCVGLALAIITMNLFDALERMAMCSEAPSAETCCRHGECKYKPASEESRPAK